MSSSHAPTASRSAEPSLRRSPSANQSPPAAAADWTRTRLEAWFGFAPRVEASREAPAAARGGEGYALRAEPGLVVLGARTLRGAKWAAHALCQAALRLRGGWTLPALDIEAEIAYARLCFTVIAFRQTFHF